MAIYVHAVITIAFGILGPVAYYTGWIDSIRFISFLSIYSPFVTHAVLLQNARQAKEQREIQSNDT